MRECRFRELSSEISQRGGSMFLTPLAVQKDHGSGNENGHFPSALIRPLFENEA